MNKSKLNLSLVVGLGNDSEKYSETRHNVGFWFVDALAKHQNFNWKKDVNVNGYISGDKYHLLKPSTMMNNSGLSVSQRFESPHLHQEKILVAHDDIDLPCGTVKLNFGAGHGGHKGVLSINNALGSKNYWRLRIGVGKTEQKISDYVLEECPIDEKEKIESCIVRVLNSWEYIINGNMDNAIKLIHTGNKKNKNCEGNCL